MKAFDKGEAVPNNEPTSTEPVHAGDWVKQGKNAAQQSQRSRKLKHAAANAIPHIRDLQQAHRPSRHKYILARAVISIHS